MSGKIQTLFNKYQTKYPLYNRDALVDLMLKDGVITLDVAKKIKSGVSLFLIDNSFSETSTQNNEFSMTNILGGNFKKTSGKNIKKTSTTNIKKEIDVNQYSYQAIKKRYPEDKYNITERDWGKDFHIITVTNKKDDSLVLEVSNFDDNIWGYKTNSQEMKNYDMAGQPIEITDKNKEEIFSLLDSKNDSKTIVQKIDKLLDNFSMDNISILLGDRKHDKQILSKIMESRKLNINDRINLIQKIFNKVYQSLEKKSINPSFFKEKVDEEILKQKKRFLPSNGEELDIWAWRISRFTKKVTKNKEKPANGKIDQDFAQGCVGDCWALAGIKALANNENGLKILNDSIKLDNNKNVIVTLKGVNKTYKITQSELKKYQSKYSYGDADVRALEIAIDKYIQEKSNSIDGYIDNNNRNDIDGNYPSLLFYLLTGKGKLNFVDKMYNQIRNVGDNDSDIENFNNKNKAFVAITPTNMSPVYINDGKDLILEQHAYTIDHSDKNYVYLINPHDTSRTFAISIKDYKKYFKCTFEVDL